MDQTKPIGKDARMARSDSGRRDPGRDRLDRRVFVPPPDVPPEGRCGVWPLPQAGAANDQAFCTAWFMPAVGGSTSYAVGR